MAQKSGFDFFGFGGKPGDESEVREKFWRTAKRAARQIPFMEELVAAYYCAFDRNTPNHVRAVLGLGFTDDIAVLTAAITTVKAHITSAHRLAAKQAIADNG